MLYRSVGSSSSSQGGRMVANAFSVVNSRPFSKRMGATTNLHTRITVPNARTSKYRRFQTTTRPYPKCLASSSRRLFSTTTIVDENSKPVSGSTSLTTTKIAAIPSLSSEQQDWKDSPLVNPTITFETLVVPNSQLTKWITHPELQHKLAKPDNWEFLKHIHPRIKVVQDYKEEDESNSNDDNEQRRTKHKQLLLLPTSVSHDAANNHTATGIPPGNEQINGNEGDAWLNELISQDEHASSIRKGPPLSMSFSPQQLSFQYLLKRLLPESAHPLPSSYEQIGHVAHFNLKEKHLPYKHTIGSALLESTSRASIQTVVNKVGQVDGKFRTYECEILANIHTSGNKVGADGTLLSLPSLETTVVEDGISIELNVAECYWCTRLSGERQELIKDMLLGRKQTSSKKQQRSKQQPSSKRQPPPLVVADVFCGAGAVCMLLAKKIKDRDKPWKAENQQKHQQQQPTNGYPSLTILANDWNPRAIEFMKRSLTTNGMDKEQDKSLYHNFELSCRDSFDFLSELGEEKQVTRVNPYIKRLRKKNAKTKPSSDPEPNTQEQPPLPPLMPDHVLMNFPLEAPRFLGALRWWSWKRLEEEGRKRQKLRNDGGNDPWYPRMHVYTFARSSSSHANDEDEMAVNLVANELLPQPFFEDNDDEGTTETQGSSNDDDALSTPVYRRCELDDEFGTEFSTRIVRDVAPGKVVVCVGFSVTPKLIRYMQGDYS